MQNAGVNWVDAPVVIDNNIISSRKPIDLEHFCNAILKYDSDTELIWKDLIPSKIGNEIFLPVNKQEIVSNMSLEDKLSILNWFEKFEDNLF